MINKFKTSSNYTKEDIIHEFKKLINDFKHVEKNKNLNQENVMVNKGWKEISLTPRASILDAMKY